VVDTTVARQATIGADARVGPFTSLEPGATVPPGTVTGAHYGAPDDRDALPWPGERDTRLGGLP